MTFNPFSTAPLIYYPAQSLQPYNWNNASAWSGNNWLNESPTASRSSTYGFTNGFSGKLVRAPGTDVSALNRNDSQTYLKLYSTAPYYLYCRFFSVDSAANGLIFRLNLNLYSDAGITTLYSDVSDYNVGTDLLTDGTWQLTRLGPITTDLSNLYRADIRIELIAGDDIAGTVYFADVFFGHVLDFQDLGPLTQGASIAHPYSAPIKVPTVSNRIHNGNYQSLRFNAGWNIAKFVTGPFNNDAKTTVNYFNDYCSDGTKFTLYYDRTVINRDYYQTCIIPGGMSKDGFTQIPGSPLWRWERDWELSL